MFKTIASVLTWSLSVGFTLCLSVGTAPNTSGPNSRVTEHEDTMTETGIQYCGSLDDPTIETTGDKEVGPGFWITNHDISSETKYFLYENSRDQHPWKYLSLPKGATEFVSVCGTWQGRVVRGVPEVNLDGGAHNLGTWFKSSVAAADGAMWGDVSFQEGCDGGGGVAATDGSGAARACYEDLLAGAPDAALAAKQTGTRALGRLVGDRPNGPARDWELSRCSADQVWIDAGNGNPVVRSANGRLKFVFHKGMA